MTSSLKKFLNFNMSGKAEQAFRAAIEQNNKVKLGTALQRFSQQKGDYLIV
jgi:hypothetical protein